MDGHGKEGSQSGTVKNFEMPPASTMPAVYPRAAHEDGRERLDIDPLNPNELDGLAASTRTYFSDEEQTVLRRLAQSSD